ncbi:MAG: CBS domain-containing protein, partial [Planctomycetes bacterium]|nr:CBS domain-containing protein [Planctomycetota bacterium]
DDRRIETRNVICTIGNAQHPLLRNQPVEQNRGRVVTDEFLRLKGHTNVWAIGDCAATPDGFGGTAPPTAQFATRLGERAAHNIAASLTGRALRPFQYQALGQVATLGHRTGVCYVAGIRLSGFVAWWLARTIHLMRLPGLERRIRVVMDWTFDLFFPRDLNYLDLEKTQGVSHIHVEPGELLFRQGDRSGLFYVIEEGTVELCRIDSSGRAVICEELGPGSHFGEGSLIRDRVRTTTATAKTSARLLVIGPKDFSSLLASCSALRQALHETSFRFRPEEELDDAPWPDEFLATPVAQIMTAPVETLADSATIADAFRVVAERRRGNLPLVDATGRLIGMVTRTDLYRVVADGRDLHGTVGDIASRQLTTLRPDQSLREALATLRRKRIKHAPVVDEACRPVGMLSYMDVALASVRGGC